MCIRDRLNIIQQNIEQNYKQIVVEFGKSFYQLSQLYPDRSLHIDYNGSSPLVINPFYTAGKDVYKRQRGAYRRGEEDTDIQRYGL